jgi:hypothetical protein
MRADALYQRLMALIIEIETRYWRVGALYNRDSCLVNELMLDIGD